MKIISSNRTIYLTTDTHWNHERILLYDSRPFDNVKEMNEYIISQISDIVQDGDILIHLGDVIFKDRNLLKGYMERIKGYKILLKGNHDRNTLSWYTRNGFDYVCRRYEYKNIIFSHKPMDMSENKIQYNIHGHFHKKDNPKCDRENGGLRYKYDFYNEKRNLCLYIDDIPDWKPIKLEDFLKLKTHI